MRQRSPPLKEKETILRIEIRFLSGPHRRGPTGTVASWVAARVEGLAEALGSGGSRRVAEQAAAAAMLVREGVWAQAGESGAVVHA